MSRIVQELYQVCHKNADRTAAYFLNGKNRESRTFAELDSDIRDMRAYLQQGGVSSGDRILAFASSGYSLCVFMFASLTMGASIMYVDIHTKQENIREIFRKTGPSHILVSDRTRFARILFPEFRKIHSVINIDRVPKGAESCGEPEEIKEDAAGLITVTTGSTGTPKLFLRTHKDLYEQFLLTTRNNDRAREEDIALTTSYIYIFSNLLQGMTTAIPNVNLGARNTKKIIRKLKAFRDLPVTRIMTSPDFCLRTPNMYPALQILYFGGAILNLHEAQRIRKEYADCRIEYIYGSTEQSLISTTTLDEYIRDLTEKGVCCLGKPCSGVSVRISEEGNITVKSDALLTRSFDAYSLKDGYYDTHDAGEMQEEKILYRGKAGFAVPVHGAVLYANEMEQQVILRFPAIPKCAAIYYQDHHWLFVEKSPVSLSDIRKYVTERWDLDVTVHELDTIPKDVKHHTKINYLKLREVVEKLNGC